MKIFAVIFLTAFAEIFSPTVVRSQSSVEDSLTWYWHQVYFAEHRNDTQAILADYTKVLKLCVTEPLDICEWYKGTCFFGISRAQANSGNIKEAREALGRALAHHFWNFELIHKLKIFDSVCGSVWVDSLCSYWAKVRETEIPFWHSQPSMVLKPSHIEKDKKYPFIIVLQGGNDCYERLVKRLTLLPDSIGAIFALPAAVHRISDVTNSWDDDTAAGEAKISALINELSKDPSIDTANISLIGFSQGAEMAYEYSFDHPTQIHSVFAFAGFPPKSFQEDEFKKVAANHLNFIAISGSTDYSDFVNATRELQKRSLEHGIQFDLKIEPDLPHGLPLNITEYFGNLWKANLPKENHTDMQSKCIRSR
jgi:predicted esterase